MTAKHPCAGKVDDALHHPDGTHRTTPRFTSGRLLERHEETLRRHLAAIEEYEADFPRVTHIQRRLNTPSGNPRYNVTIGGVTTYTTENDIADAYGIEELVGQPVQFETRDGKLTTIWKAGTR
jgi:hypothetical protein